MKPARSPRYPPQARQVRVVQQGTILLDEIGEMPPSLQAKLLHVLQDQQFSRLGVAL